MRAALDVVQRAVALTALAFLLAGCGCSSCEQDPVPVGGGPPPADRLADFTLEDVNPASATGALPLSVRQQLGTVSAWYFGHATWSYCRAQFGRLDAMQAEIRGLGPSTEVRILGVNGIGHEAGNDAMCTGRTIPLLQDVTGVDAYGLWAVTYRDVVILDASNRLVTVFNLTAQDLGDPTHYAALRDLLLAAAQ